ncbi:hypothetical protein AFR_26040 [Actinoplanes friuliensis DSM 7358]|uniref:Uncharacterized protein n=2 Tax=Actinoplanes friuliensis TaxID=196914 RepID=U5W376_9ACTN|nr:hypothetical protein AFR_26040 [Actinoplanes friuliensis DSM 7358]
MGFSRSGLPTHLEPWRSQWAPSGNDIEINFIPDYVLGSIACARSRADTRAMRIGPFSRCLGANATFCAASCVAWGRWSSGRWGS